MAKKHKVEDSDEEEPHDDEAQESPLKKQRIGNDSGSQDEDDYNDANASPGTPVRNRDESSSHHNRDAIASPIRNINPPGRPAEAGIIHKVYAENFMCHRKLTISLCKNVNFIHGK